MTNFRSICQLIGAAALLACGTTEVTELATGLTGTVTRSPITPVCQLGVPCSAPFSANFTVRQGSHVVASFHSDTQGGFTVRLPAGDYQVVPASDAPIIQPGSQAKDVMVAAGPLTTVHLDFDTGLR
jgi:hypothetical protein